ISSPCLPAQHVDPSLTGNMRRIRACPAISHHHRCRKYDHLTRFQKTNCDTLSYEYAHQFLNNKSGSKVRKFSTSNTLPYNFDTALAIKFPYDDNLMMQ